MLAEGIEFDVLDDDHLLVFLIENRRADDLDPVLGIALGQELHGLRDPLRGLLQAFPLRVFPEEPEDSFHMGRDLRGRLPVIFLNCPVCHLDSLL